MELKLKIGEIITEGNTVITILDEAVFCYRVLSERNGKRGIRLISKSILEEFVNYVKQHPEAKASEVRMALSGRSSNDKYEYGYDSTFLILAKRVIERIKK